MWKGHSLRPPASVLRKRPTSSRVREAVFDILGPGDLDGMSIWDLCCGSGAFGIEALSLSAAHCLFVDNDSLATEFVRDFLGKRGATDRARVVTGDVMSIVPEVEDRPDLVYMDPPYRSDELYSWAGLLDWQSVIAPGGAVFLEAGSDRDIPGWEARKYGDTCLFRWREKSL
jgi:16S rRNA (guanine966-N2)-methyltransferase